MTKPSTSRPAFAVPRRWLLSYLVGTVIVVGLLVFALIDTSHQFRGLADQVDAARVPHCGHSVSTRCRADRPATVVATKHGQDSNEFLLKTSFLSDTSDLDECFGTDCRDDVHLRSADGTHLRTGEAVTIDAGRGRIYSLATATSSWPTLDNPRVALFSTAGGLVWTLYLDAFGVTWLAAYVFLTLTVRPWRFTIAAVRRALNLVTLVSAVGAVATIVGLSLNGGRGLIVVLAALLFSGCGGLLARRHSGHAADEVDADLNTHWRQALNRAGLLAFYTLVAFPLPIALAVALDLLHDETGWVAPTIVLVVGAVLTPLFLYRMHRSVTGRTPRKA